MEGGKEFNFWLDILEKKLNEKVYEHVWEYISSGELRLSDSDKFSTIDVSLTPWFKVIADWHHDNSVNWIYLIQGSQTGKTTIMMAIFDFVCKYVKGAVPTRWTFNREDKAGIFITRRLKQFIQAQGDKLKKQKNEFTQKYIRVHNSECYVGWGTSEDSLKTTPTRYSFNDECSGYTVSLKNIRDRHRSYKGKGKGYFATTPPSEEIHESWQNAIMADFFQLFIACPKCEKRQALKFNQLKWYQRENEEELWDYAKVAKTTKFQCKYCLALIDHEAKKDLIKKSTLQCVNPNDEFKPCKFTSSDSRTLHISAMYSHESTWGDLAVEFLKSKKAGIEALKIFFVNDLAEPFKQQEKEYNQKDLAELIRPDIKRGNSNYPVVAMGVDVQRLGYLYAAVYGFLPSVNEIYEAHIIDYKKIPWINAYGQASFKEFLDYCNSFDNLDVVALDATDGCTNKYITTFCDGTNLESEILFLPLYDNTQTSEKITLKYKGDTRTQDSIESKKFIVVNSDIVKNDILFCIEEKEGLFFHSETDDRFLRHFKGERRVKHTIKRKGRILEQYIWKKTYENAVQHFFSASVYGYVLAELLKDQIFEEFTIDQDVKESYSDDILHGVISNGVSIWD